MSWLPNWAQKMARVFEADTAALEREEALRAFQARRARMTIIVAEVNRWAEAVKVERNLEQLEAILERMEALSAEARDLTREAVWR